MAIGVASGAVVIADLWACARAERAALRNRQGSAEESNPDWFQSVRGDTRLGAIAVCAGGVP